MRYYCNICKKDITKEEFLYSLDKFDRPLCREHQQVERDRVSNDYETKYEPEDVVEEQIAEEEITTEEPESGFKSLLRKVAVATGKGIVKGTKKIVDHSKKTIQIRKWKDGILRRMSMGQLKQLCFENRISTKKSVMKQDGRSGGFYFKQYNCTKIDLVNRLKSKIPLDDIIYFAKRNHINIRDILRDIDNKKAQWKIKELSEKIDDFGSNLLLELEKVIREFTPPRRYYNKEIFYQDTLASWLKSKFPSTKIEKSKGSTRPDIVVNGVAIEIKGPTYEKDLMTIADKCLRYNQYFPNGMICVLFNVHVSQYRYDDWLKGMNQNYPDVVVIRKN
jgi:hypothetical protein